MSEIFPCPPLHSCLFDEMILLLASFDASITLFPLCTWLSLATGAGSGVRQPRPASLSSIDLSRGNISDSTLLDVRFSPTPVPPHPSIAARRPCTPFPRPARLSHAKGLASRASGSTCIRSFACLDSGGPPFHGHTHPPFTAHNLLRASATPPLYVWSPPRRDSPLFPYQPISSPFSLPPPSPFLLLRILEALPYSVV